MPVGRPSGRGSLTSGAPPKFAYSNRVFANASIVVATANVDLAATEAADTAAFAISAQTGITLAATEAPDVAAFAITAKTGLTLAATEAADTAAIALTDYWAVTLAATEAADTAALAISAKTGIALAATEAADIAALAITAKTNVALAATETADAAAFSLIDAAAQWSATAKNAHAVLSNGALTVATDGTPATHFAGRSIPTVVVPSAGKKYWEVTVTAVGATHDAGVGVVNASETFGDDAYLGSQSNGYGYYEDGAIYFGGPQVATLAGFTTGDVIGIAVDGGNKVWFRVNNGLWNNSGTDNPATNTGGISVAGMGDLFPAYNVRGSGQLTADFGATAFAFAVPAGFTSFVTAATAITLAATEAPDTAVFTLVAKTNVALAASEAADIAAFAASVTSTSIAVTFSITEAPDVAAFNLAYWQPVPDNSDTWTPVTPPGSIWTPVNPPSPGWGATANSSTIWTPQVPPAWVVSP